MNDDNTTDNNTFPPWKVHYDCSILSILLALSSSRSSRTPFPSMALICFIISFSILLFYSPFLFIPLPRKALILPARVPSITPHSPFTPSSYQGTQYDPSAVWRAAMEQQSGLETASLGRASCRIQLFWFLSTRQLLTFILLDGC